MSSQFCVNLVIERRLSRRLLLLYAVLFGAAIVGAGIADISMVLKGGILAMLVTGAVLVFQHHIQLSDPDSIVALHCSAEQWTVHTRDGNSRQARLVSAAFWVFDIIPLVFVAADGKRFSVLLTPDRVPANPLRELRAWIRHRLPAA